MYTYLHEQLRKKRRLVVGLDHQLRKNIIDLWHNSILTGHSGIDKTHRKVATIFYWKGLRDDVKEYVKGCDVCQRHKYDNAPYPGLLQPLKIPISAWSSINMDFNDGLPKSQRKTLIWVVMDRLIKYAHFMSCLTPTLLLMWPRCSWTRYINYIVFLMIL